MLLLVHKRKQRLLADSRCFAPAYSCLLTSTPHSYSRLFVRAILYPNQGLTHKRRIEVSLYVFWGSRKYQGEFSKTEKNLPFSTRNREWFCAKNRMVLECQINRERNSVWHFILQDLKSGVSVPLAKTQEEIRRQDKYCLPSLLMNLVLMVVPGQSLSRSSKFGQVTPMAGWA